LEDRALPAVHQQNSLYNLTSVVLRRARARVWTAMLSVALALLSGFIGAVTLFVAWFFLWPADEAPRPPTRNKGPMPQIRKQSEAELKVQNERCREVKQRSLAAAERLKVFQREDDVDGLLKSLSDLQNVVAENESDGSLGVVATTELCNALLDADALRCLDALRKHTNDDVVQRSTALFQHVIPRIWSF
jgi:hypothetical protein